MNVVEAMRQSQKTDEAFTRKGVVRAIKWEKEKPKFMYGFSAEDLLADDWEPLPKVAAVV